MKKISRMHIKRPRNIQIPTVKFTPCLMCCISNFFNFLPRTNKKKSARGENNQKKREERNWGKKGRSMYGTDLMIGKTFPAEFVFALFTIMEFYR